MNLDFMKYTEVMNRYIKVSFALPYIDRNKLRPQQHQISKDTTSQNRQLITKEYLIF